VSRDGLRAFILRRERFPDHPQSTPIPVYLSPDEHPPGDMFISPAIDKPAEAGIINNIG